MNLDQSDFVHKCGDIIQYKNQCLTGTISNLKNEIIMILLLSSEPFGFVHIFPHGIICTAYSESGACNCLCTISPL